MPFAGSMAGGKGGSLPSRRAEVAIADIEDGSVQREAGGTNQRRREYRDERRNDGFFVAPQTGEQPASSRVLPDLSSGARSGRWPIEAR